jgi:hypothetical protein
MTKRSIVLASVLSLVVVACATEESPTPEVISSAPESELALKGDRSGGDVSALWECRDGLSFCPGDASACYQRNDVEYDCEAPFRIDSTDHCGGGPGMFQRVEHWEQCDESSWGACVRVAYIGRYFLYCL